jgi:hypothetical protein
MFMFFTVRVTSIARWVKQIHDDGPNVQEHGKQILCTSDPPSHKRLKISDAVVQSSVLSNP